MTQTYFFDMIQNLRQSEEVMLYQNILKIGDSEKEKLADFLHTEYQSESLSYPFTAPSYDAKAALWAAEFVYVAAQLILYRKNKAEELETLLPKSRFEVNPSTALSLDLCFRFVPDMLRQLQLIDSEDPLLPILEEQLQKWHYSGINYPLSIADEDFEIMLSDPCLQQLYLNRIVSFKNLKLARHPVVEPLLKANFGIYEDSYWKEFKSINPNE